MWGMDPLPTGGALPLPPSGQGTEQEENGVWARCLREEDGARMLGKMRAPRQTGKKIWGRESFQERAEVSSIQRQGELEENKDKKPPDQEALRPLWEPDEWAEGAEYSGPTTGRFSCGRGFHPCFFLRRNGLIEGK